MASNFHLPCLAHPQLKNPGFATVSRYKNIINFDTPRNKLRGKAN